MNEQTATPVIQGSYCTRCGAMIPLHGVQLYIDADHLCQNCAATSDSTYAQELVRAEKGKNREHRITA